MSIPFLDLKRQYESIREDVEKSVLSCMESCGYIEGPAVKQFEKNMASYLDVKHVITCASGTDALKLALRAAGVKAGDEVITTAFSFFATAEAISAVGATPVFVDINETDYNINVSLIEEKITDKTRAILPVHIFGCPADMDEINEIARKYGLKVVEDACQAIGSNYKGRKSGTLGDAGCFSFYPTKNLGGFGDGGMVTTNDDEIALMCRALKAHGGGKQGYEAARLMGEEAEEIDFDNAADSLYDPYKYYNYIIADNSRLDSIQAAVLDIKLRKLDDYNERRAAIAARYTKELRDMPVATPDYSSDRKSCWHQYAFLAEDKEGMIAYLGSKGVGAGNFYPVPLHLQKAFAGKCKEALVGACPVAESVCSRSVCLPIFPELTDVEQGEVIEAIKSYYK